MFLQPVPLPSSLSKGLMAAAEAAIRALPPAFPLEETVAVNPFLGQAGGDLALASARLERVAGVALTLPRAEILTRIARGEIADADLAEALVASTSAVKPRDLAALKARLHAPAPVPKALPTLAELAAAATGTDWPGVVTRSFGLWAAGHFDRGQALWTPRPSVSAFAAWREWATHDLTPEIAGLTGFCAHVAAAPDTAERAILRASERLGLTSDAAETVFHRLLIDLGGWAMHARWQLWQAELHGGTDPVLADLLAIRLVWEEALLAHLPQVEADWQATVVAHARPVAPSPDQVLDAILQEAAERAHQRQLGRLLSGPVAPAAKAVVQAAFCIDVRSEILRRAFEAQDPGVETLGFAGFFGLPLAHKAQGTDEAMAHLPALLAPSLVSTDHGSLTEERALRIAARARRAWGRFRQAAVSSFAFVEAAGPAYGVKLLADGLGLAKPRAPAPAPRFETDLTATQKADLAEAVLRAMSLTEGFAPVVLLIGHGAELTNAPHKAAYGCGACHGHSGAVSARLLAALLNEAETRAGLSARGILLPDTTRVVAGLHDTVSDRVTLFPDGAGPLDEVEAWLQAAGQAARAERALRLPGASGPDLLTRGKDWAQLRPEWGLAGCSAFIAAPRSVTAGRNLAGRAFLHSYDWTSDRDFATLRLILTAPVVVASWINLQYNGAVLAPDLFGGGNKLIHNVVGGLGVVEGNGGRLRPGLPIQALHDGVRTMHDPLRLTVMVEAPMKAISQVLRTEPGLRNLFDHGWLHLLALNKGRIAARYLPGLEWELVRA